MDDRQSSGGKYASSADGASTTTTTDNAVSSGASPQTAQWIQRYVPEAFGLRNAVEQSKYRWCVRESALWGIATSSALALHRIRMQSRPSFVVNIGFATFFTVYIGNYYFCVRRRDHQEKMVRFVTNFVLLAHWDYPTTLALSANAHSLFSPPTFSCWYFWIEIKD